MLWNIFFQTESFHLIPSSSKLIRQYFVCWYKSEWREDDVYSENIEQQRNSLRIRFSPLFFSGEYEAVWDLSCCMLVTKRWMLCELNICTHTCYISYFPTSATFSTLHLHVRHAVVIVAVAMAEAVIQSSWITLYSTQS